MIGGGTFSKKFRAKIFNPSTSHWIRGSLFKSSSTDIGQMEKFVKHGTQRRGTRLKVIFRSTLLLEVHSIIPKKDEVVSHCQPQFLIYLVHMQNSYVFGSPYFILNMSTTREFSWSQFCRKTMRCNDLPQEKKRMNTFLDTCKLKKY